MGIAPKILLIGPFKNSKLRVGQFLSPPNGIYRIKSFVEKKTSSKVDIVDADLEGEEAIEQKIKNNKYDIIGFSLLYPTIENDITLIHKVKSLSPKSTLVAGGQGAVFIKEELLLKTPLDIIIHGLGEFPVAQLVNSIKNGKNKLTDFKNIKGLSIKIKNKIMDTGHREFYSNKEYREISNSFDYSIVPYEKYWSYMESQYTKKELEVMKNDGLLYTIRIMTSSHCPMKCSFCSATNFLEDATGKAQCALEMSVIDIINSIKKAIKAHPKVNAFYFNDDNLLQNTKRASELCKALVKEFGTKNLNYFCLSRIDHVNPNILTLMKIANFKLIIYGVESFSNKILKEMSKKVACKDPSTLANKVILQTIDSGITPLMNLILFYPTTTIEDIVETVEKATPLIKKGARAAVYTFIEVYPGSDILKENNLEFTHNKFKVNNQQYSFPWTILPKDKKVREFSLSAVKLREEIIKEIKDKYNYKKELPHPVFSLSLFLAVYQQLKKPTNELYKIIDSMMKEAKDAKEVDVRAYERV
jgi:anaerobic magnesium-protoporphyrin IX monomethyl ester cyclase